MYAKVAHKTLYNRFEKFRSCMMEFQLKSLADFPVKKQHAPYWQRECIV